MALTAADRQALVTELLPYLVQVSRDTVASIVAGASTTTVWRPGTVTQDGTATVAVRPDGIDEPEIQASNVTGIALYEGWRVMIVYPYPHGALVCGLIDHIADVPLAAAMPYFAATAPLGDAWLFPYGQAVSRSEYADLFALIATTYGVGDGSTTFNLPDMRGRVFVALDNMGGSDAGRLSVANTLGGTGGAQTHTLTASEMPAHDHTITHTHDLANHTHTLGNHTHDLANHTHTMGNHTHGFSHTHGIPMDYTSQPHSHTGVSGSTAAEAPNPSDGVSAPGLSTSSQSTSTSGTPSTNTSGTPSSNTSGTPSTNTSGTPSSNTSGASSAADSGSAGSGGAHNNMQPYLLCNVIMRVK